MNFYNGTGDLIKNLSCFDTKDINLINPNLITDGKVSVGNGTYQDNSSYNLTDFIRLDEGNYYTNFCSNADFGYSCKIDIYNVNKVIQQSNVINEATKIVDGATTKLGYGKITISEECYVRIIYPANISNPVIVKDEYGTKFDNYTYDKKEMMIQEEYSEGFSKNIANDINIYHPEILKDIANSVRPLYGKKWIQIGDSNTAYQGQNLGNAIIEQRALGSFTNMGTAGATWAINSAGDNYSAVKKVDNLISSANPDNQLCTDYDIITIMMGTNDINIGEITDTSSQTDTMCGAIRYCLEKLCYYYRQSAIGVILPPQRAEGNSIQKTKNEKIKSICEEFAIPTLDLYNEGRIIPETMTPDGTSTYLADGLHIGYNGNFHIYRIIGAWLETI